MKDKSVITIEAKEEIRKNIAELKEVLKDDEDAHGQGNGILRQQGNA
jgi:hypothetical protein